MKKLSFVIVAMLGLSMGAFAQAENNDDTHDVTIVIPEVALLDIESTAGKNFTQSFVAPTEAGLGLGVPVAATTVLWLNYSSIVMPSGIDGSRTISVKSTTANIPAGVVIAIAAATPTGTGTKGTAGSVTALTDADQPIITAVGSCYTGDGSGSGSALTYTLTTPTGTYSSLTAATTVVNITYTLSDN